jgi:hypothetical protein
MDAWKNERKAGLRNETDKFVKDYNRWEPAVLDHIKGDVDAHVYLIELATAVNPMLEKMIQTLSPDGRRIWIQAVDPDFVATEPITDEQFRQHAAAVANMQRLIYLTEFLVRACDGIYGEWPNTSKQLQFLRVWRIKRRE